MYDTEKATSMYARSGIKQTNEWRIAVYKAITSENASKADIAILIWSKYGPSGWDGVGHNDKWYQTILQEYFRGFTKLKSKEIYIEELGKWYLQKWQWFLKEH